MKITVTITNDEVKEILMARMPSGVEIENVIVVDNSNNELYTKIKNAMIGEFGQPPFPVHRKIEAIMFIKSITAMGLADSKYAVENWDKWITFVKNFNRFPRSEMTMGGNVNFI